MNIWMFNHYAQASNEPGGTRHFDMAKELVKKGHSVSIIASGFHHVTLEHKVQYIDSYKCEEIEKVNFIWVKTRPYKKNNIFRILNLISYYFKAQYAISKLHLEKPDIIIGSTVHPFAALIASKLAKKYGVAFLYEIQDLWPQTLIDMNLWKEKSFKSRVFRYLESLCVKRAQGIITLSPLTQEYLYAHYQYKKENILYLPNGVSDDFLQTIQVERNENIKIIYMGGIDKVHGLDFIVTLAKELESTQIEFHIYGEGKEKEKLKLLSLKLRVENIMWHKAVAKTSVPQKLAEADLLLLSTSNVLYGSENKLHEYMASARPIIFSTVGSHNTPLDKVNCGFEINKNDIKQSAQTIREFILDNEESFECIGNNGREYVLKYRTITILVKKLETFLNGVIWTR